ncbi:MAG: hypothetical protein WC716_09475 [Chitinophagaceae bacterium]|jgi:hypothetical protein
MKKGFPFIPGIIAVIVGVALYKQIDFQNFKVEKPALSAVYLLTVIFCMVVIVRNSGKK